MRFLFGFIGSMMDRVLCAAFALVLAQFPVYVNQYIDVLSGARMEATKAYQALEAEAQRLNIDVERFVRHHEESNDSIFQASGRLHRRTIQRYKSLNEAFDALTTASIWQKPLVWRKYFDPDINQAIQFEWGVPFNTEGAVYALVGLMLGLILSLSLQATGRGIRKLVLKR